MIATGTEAVYREYLEAIRVGDRRGALAVVARARAEGMDHRRLYLEVFQPALQEIGRLWQDNQIGVADEHLATAITQTAMARLYDDLFTLSRGGGPVMIAACVDSERHEVGLRMMCDLLELEGWDTVYLGASTPIESLVALVSSRKPAVVALSASLAPHLARLREVIHALRERMGQETPLVIVGGRLFSEDPGLAARLGADLTARDAVEAVELLQERFAT
ncbi:MAG: cobalamin-dependent protein [Gemmatimonadetes bacterium]|nr:cobalamin-dependent protein [Gemmatimonadota bacterium]